MTKKEIIKSLITDRQNTLSVKAVVVNINNGSMGNPCIRVGTKPFYEWSKVKQIEYVITYGRYLNCEMLVYDKQIKSDNAFTIVFGKKKAAEIVSNIIDSITEKTNQ